jgi:hypothetical protein
MRQHSTQLAPYHTTHATHDVWSLVQRSELQWQLAPVGLRMSGAPSAVTNRHVAHASHAMHAAMRLLQTQPDQADGWRSRV